MLTIAHLTSTPFLNESRLMRENIELARMFPAAKLHVVARNDRQNALPASETIGPAHVTRLARKTFRLRGLALLYWWYMCCRWLVMMRPQIVFLHVVMLLPVGIFARLFLGCRLVYDAHELETESATLAKSPLRRLAMKSIERVGMLFVDLTLTVSPSIQKWYQSHYPRANVGLVPNYPNLGIAVQTPATLHQRCGLDQNVKLYLYLGNMSRGRGIPVILEAAARITRPDICFVFVGYGDLSQDIEAAQAAGLPVRYIPAVPPAEVVSLASGAHVGISLIENVCLSYYYCYPNKLFEYVAAGLPVIVSDFPDMGAFVDRYGVGWRAEVTADGFLAQVELSADADIDAVRQRVKKAAPESRWERAAVEFRNKVGEMANRLPNTVRMATDR